MSDFTERLKEIVTAGKEILDDPSFRLHAKKLESESIEFQARQRELAKRVRLEQSGIPRRYWEMLESPKRTAALEALDAFIAGPQDCTYLLLLGPAGRGKTAALTVGAYRAGGIYWDCQELLRESTFDTSLWRNLREAPFVALDELGAEATNPAWEANLYDLLNGRDAELRRTVLASNLNGPAIRARYASAGLQRLVDRIQSHGSLVTLPGPSMRVPFLQLAQPPERD